MAEEILDKKGVIKAIIVATVIALVGIAVLGWEYRRIEKERLPALEQAIEEQEEAMEKELVQEVLDRFMVARIGQNEDMAKHYLTEKAAEQARLNDFYLIDDFASYEILQSEKIEEGKYRFVVKIYYKELPVELTEIITLIKVLDKYYVDSVQVGG
jgi:hypothetical protein